MLLSFFTEEPGPKIGGDSTSKWAWITGKDSYEDRRLTLTTLFSWKPWILSDIHSLCADSKQYDLISCKKDDCIISLCEKPFVSTETIAYSNRFARMYHHWICIPEIVWNILQIYALASSTTLSLTFYLWSWHI